MSALIASRGTTEGVNGSNAPPNEALKILRDRNISLPASFPRLPTKELRAGHRQPVRGLGWSVDGRKLATCGGDRVVRVWVPERSIDFRASTELRGHTESVDQLAWHPLNPDLLATASADKTVRIWDTRASSQSSTSAAAQIIATPGANINIAYHPSGNYLAVGDKSDTVSIIDTQLGKIVHTVSSRRPAAASSTSTSKTIWSNPEEINEMCWSPDGELLLLSSGMGAIHVHTTTDYSRIYTVNAHTANVFCLQWDPYSRFVASASSDSMISLWDTSEWYSYKMITSLSAPARSISFSHDGELLAAGGEDPYISIHATSSNASGSDDLVHKIQLPPSTMINTLAWHPSKHILAYAGDDTGTNVGIVRVYGL